jgi:glutaredoxin
MNFTIYSKPNCPFCDKIKIVLNEFSKSTENCNLKILDYETDYTRDDFISKFGKHSTFPQVIMDGLHLGGCVDTVKYLQDKNLIKGTK